MTKEIIQAAGSAYFAERTEKNLQKLYNLIEPVIIKISNAILRDDELSKDNLSRVMLKIVNNKNFTFDPDKSFLSFVYNTSKNSAIILYNQRKSKKEYAECDLKIDGAEDIENLLDYIAFDSQESLRIMEHDEIKIDEQDPFHLDVDGQFRRVYDMVAELTNSEADAELMRDVMFGGFGPKEIKDHYGINSRITVSSRKTRLCWKIKESLRLELNGSKFLQRDLENGNFLLRYKTGTIKMTGSTVNYKLDGLLTSYSPLGVKFTEVEFKKGVRDGDFREFYSESKIRCVKDLDLKMRHKDKTDSNETDVIQRDTDGSPVLVHGINVTGDLNSLKITIDGVTSMPTQEQITHFCKKNKEGVWDGTKITIGNIVLYPTKELLNSFFEITHLIKRTGKFSGDKRVGVWKIYFESGKLSEKYCQDSTYFEIYKESGEMETENGCGFLKANVTPHKVYHGNGVVKVEGFILDDKKVGVWRRFNDAGILEEEVDYVEKKYRYKDEDDVVQEGVLTF